MRTLSRIAAAATLAAAAYAGIPAAPASAASCPSADGVTVVVDFHELGGGVQSACVADGGGDTAASLFPAAGFPLTYVQRQQSFVCRVSGKPADDPCVNTPPADAYWALYWSDGKSGSWTYATMGAGSQRVPDGGYVAFSWTGSSARSTPGVSPTPHPAAEPTPTKEPTRAPSHAPSPAGSGGSPSGPAPAGGQPTASASGSPGSGAGKPETKPGKPGKPEKPGGKDRAGATATPTDTASPTDAADADVAEVAPASSEAVDPADDGLPTWVTPAAIVVLFGAAGGAALARRRRTGRP